MNCEQTRASLSAYLDNELPAAETAAAGAHLAACPACAAELSALKSASRAVRDLPLKPLPAGFMARLEARRSGAAPSLGLASLFGPKPLAFAAAAVVAALVVAGPWRSQRLARAPGGPLAESAAVANAITGYAASPVAARAKGPAEVPPPPAPAAAAAPAAPAAPAAQAVESMDSLADKKAAPKGELSASRGEALEMPAPTKAKKSSFGAAAGGGGAGGAGVARGAPSGSPVPYSNEELHDLLQKESDAAGYKGAARDEPEPESDGGFMGKRLGAPGSREQSDEAIRQLQTLRKTVDENSGKAATVPIEGTVAPVLGAASEERGGRAFDAEAPLSDGFWSGNYAAGNEGSRTVEDAAAWSTLWRTLSTAPAPAVDFKRSMVVAVFLGPRPTGGYAVEFGETKRLARSLLIRWRERSPEAGMSPPDGATSPYAMKVLPRSDVPVRFEKTR